MALADAMEKHSGNFDQAFKDYNQNLRPYIEEIQAIAEENVREKLYPQNRRSYPRKKRADESVVIG